MGSNAVNPVVSTPHKLRHPEIPKPLSMSLVVMPPHHHQLALSSLIGELLLIFAEEISSTFEPRGFAVLSLEGLIIKFPPTECIHIQL